MLFGAYLMNQVFNDPILGGNGNITFDALDKLSMTFSTNQQVNGALIFGDFIAALQLLFGIIIGSTVNSALQLLPFVGIPILLLQGMLFNLASVFLFIYIISNRSI